MSEKENTFKVAKEYMERSDKAISAAQLLFKNEFFEDAISRAYYSVFHASKALLCLLGEDTRTHKGLQVVFGIRVIKEGLLEQKFGRILNKLLSFRESADYGIVSFISEEDARNAINDAEVFITKIKDLLSVRFKF